MSRLPRAQPPRLAFLSARRAVALCLVFIASATAPGRAQTWALDPSFAPDIRNEATSPVLDRIIPLPNGGALVTGGFTHANGIPLPGILRLTPEGKIDPAFVPDFASADFYSSIAALPDGSFLVAINRNTSVPAIAIAGPPQLTRPSNPAADLASGISRILPSGRRDRAYQPPVAIGPRLFPLADGRVLVSDSFGPATALRRLSSDGAVDPAFRPELPPNLAFLTTVTATPDGGFLAAGAVNASNISYAYFISKHTASGSIEPTFGQSKPPHPISLLAALPDGRAYVGEDINLTRLLRNGATDPSFSLRVPRLLRIERLEVLPDGRLIVGALIGSTFLTAEHAVYLLGDDGTIALTLGDLPGSERSQDLVGALPDGRILLRQTKLALLPNGGAPTPVSPELVTVDLKARSPAPWNIAVTARSYPTISQIALDSAGRVLVKGSFNSVDGQPRPGFARFLLDGTLDRTFVPTTGNTVLSLPDGGWIANLSTLAPPTTDGVSRTLVRTVRLSSDGRVDPTFSPPSETDLPQLRWLTAAKDGRILVAAFESDRRRESDLRLMWLDPSGQRLSSLPAEFSGLFEVARLPLPPFDPTLGSAYGLYFNSAVVVSPTIERPQSNTLTSAQILPDGRILIAGGFQSIDGSTRPSVARLRNDGTLDASYAPDLTGFDVVGGARFGPDGSALVYGTKRVTTGSGFLVQAFRPDGRPDSELSPSLAAIAISIPLADGSYFYASRHFNRTGDADLGYAPELRGIAYAAEMAPDGRLWIGGQFDTANGEPRASLARFSTGDRRTVALLPQNQSIKSGADATLQASLGTREPATYQWSRDGVPLPGATSALLSFRPAGVTDAGSYRVTVSVGGATMTSEPVTLAVTPMPSRLSNFSARSRIDPSTPQVAGFVCNTDVPRSVLLRSVGRGLPAGLGVNSLPTPVMELYRGDRLVAEDTGSVLAPNIAELAQATGAFPIAPVSPTSFVNYGSALSAQLTRGAYTVVTKSGDIGAGTALFEFYEVNPPAPNPFVRNLSFRGQTSPGDATLIVGFAISGDTPLRLLVRGLGPALANFPIAGAIADPRIAVYASGATEALAQNEDWGGDAAIAEAARRVAAFPLPASSRDAALLLTLPPGIYTTQLSAANAATGIGMIEIYLVE